MDKQKSDQLSRSSQPILHRGHQALTRRRGEILENAILQAAWDELNEVGYAHMSMEGVAARAKTNKVAVYRRWPNKSKLVIAALGKFVPRPFTGVPDTGNLRSDVLILLNGILKPLQIIGAETLHGLMVEHGRDLMSSIPQIKRQSSEDKWATTMMTILKNAQKRGEVKIDKIDARIISLPADLLRYELLMTHEPVSETTITEIVDNIFLPLIHLQA
jgi:hypothetical protein